MSAAAGTEPAAATSKGPKKGDPKIIVNLPNALTALRLVLCLAFFGIFISATGRLDAQLEHYGMLPHAAQQMLDEPGRFPADEVAAADLYATGPDRGLALLFDIAFAIFALAAITDTLDGQIARRWGLETDFGRIADPFVDKIMILGALVLLMPLTVTIAGWMVVLVLARELLVQGIRGFAESRGIAFPATFWGKTKMVSQILAVGCAVLYVGHPGVAWWKNYVYLPLLWLAIATTVMSGLVYMTRARAVLRLGKSGGAA